MFKILLICISLITQIEASVSLAAHNNTMVKKMIEKIHQEHHIPKAWLTEQFNNLKLNDAVLNLMQKPFEAKPWAQYQHMMITKTRIDNGKTFMLKNQAVIQNYEKKYRIPGSIVSAIIGIETSYGRNKGNFNILEALSTLAFYYTPRSQYFYSETVSLLRYAYQNNLDINSIKSSYAGAVGIPQFMPSNIEKYGMHHGSKGKIDIYNNHHDAIASVFNYLKTKGQWAVGQPVMKKLNLPKDKAEKLQALLANTRLLKVDKHIQAMFNLRKDAPSWLIKLQQQDGSYAYYRVYQNFRAIMKYNNSVHYSSAVYQLSTKIAYKAAAETQ